jgi:hypothetical protein
MPKDEWKKEEAKLTNVIYAKGYAKVHMLYVLVSPLKEL